MSSELDQSVIKSEEKTMAMFSHFTYFLGGYIFAIVIWLIYRNKSEYVEFHVLQAVWFHIILSVLSLGLGMLFGLIMAITDDTNAHTKNIKEFFLSAPILIFYAIMFLKFLVISGYSLYMGLKANKGSFYKYPLIGNFIYKKVYGTN